MLGKNVQGPRTLSRTTDDNLVKNSLVFTDPKIGGANHLFPLSDTPELASMYVGG